MFQDRCYDRDVEINNNYFAEDMNNYNDTDFNIPNQGSTMNYMNDNGTDYVQYWYMISVD